MAMEMDHSFTVPVSPVRAWDVLLDVERIAPCMPGATVDEFDGEVVTGRIKVKVGPVSLTYRGTAKFTERDADDKHIMLEASGKETRGAGTASATVQASLEPEPDGQATKVSMHTTMNVTGRPAQFGRGVMVEVGGKLVEQFAQNLRQLIADGGPAAPAEAGTGTGTGAGAEAGAGGTATAEEGADADPSPGDQARTSVSPVASSAPSAAATSTATAPPAAAQADSINLVRLVGPALLKRAIPIAAGLAALALLGRRFRHLFRRSSKK